MPVLRSLVTAFRVSWLVRRLLVAAFAQIVTTSLCFVLVLAFWPRTPKLPFSNLVVRSDIDGKLVWWTISQHDILRGIGASVVMSERTSSSVPLDADREPTRSLHDWPGKSGSETNWKVGDTAGPLYGASRWAIITQPEINLKDSSQLTEVGVGFPLVSLHGAANEWGRVLAGDKPIEEIVGRNSNPPVWPTSPLWGRAVANFTLTFAAVVGFQACWLGWRRWRAHRAGTRPCAECGYDLRGLPEDAKCPECGHNSHVGSVSKG